MPRFLRWSTYRLRTKGLIVVALPLAPLAVFWLAIALAITHQPKPANLNTRSLQVQAGLARVFSALLDADAGARDYLLTDNPEARNRYRDAVDRLPSALLELDSVLIDPELRQALTTLNGLVSDELAVLARVAGEPSKLLGVVGERATLDRSTATLDRIRTLTTVIEQGQIALVNERSARLETTTGVWFWGFVGGSILCGVAGVLLAFSLARGISRRAARLSKDAGRLARGEEIEPALGGDDEIGQLDARFREAARLLRQREDELRQSAQLLDNFFTLSHDLFCIAGFDGYFKRLNPAWTATLGFSDDELKAAPFLNFVHPDDRPRKEQAAEGLAQGRKMVSFENRHLAKDGSYRWLVWNAHPHVEAGLIYASARDVTEQRQLTAELHSRTAELEAANRELEAFSYSVSHDLRAPLRAIDGFSQAIEESCVHQLDDEGRDALRRVRLAAQRMGTLIDELLNLSRISRTDLIRRAVDIGATASEILADLARRGPARHVEVHVEPELVGLGDPELVRVALQNLLDNAWKYTGRTPRPRIEVGSCPNGSTRVFHVRDNGAGFDMRYAGKLFGAFQRLHSDKDFDGTGVGLAIVHRIVRRHGGRIWAESAVDQGTTFYFTLEPEGPEHVEQEHPAG